MTQWQCEILHQRAKAYEAHSDFSNLFCPTDMQNSILVNKALASLRQHNHTGIETWY